MSMSSNENVENRFKKLLKIKNKNEKFQLIAEMLHLNMINEISNLMEQRRINKAQLAEKLDVSKSYITQLFTADKVINLKLIAQIQDIFGISFGITLNGGGRSLMEPNKQKRRKMQQNNNLQKDICRRQHGTALIAPVHIERELQEPDVTNTIEVEETIIFSSKEIDLLQAIALTHAQAGNSGYSDET